MDKTTLILTTIGLIISISAIAFTIYLNRKNENSALVRHEDNKSTERINAVVAEYTRLLNSNISSHGIQALTKSNIGILYSEDEARETINRITNSQSQRNPLGNYKTAIEEVGILNVFQDLTEKKYMANKLDEIIARHS